MTYIYVVEGSTGEYSDRAEWPVAAYRNEAEAAQLVLDATQWAMSQHVHEDNYASSYQVRHTLKNPFDPAMYIDYTGVRYRYYPVEWR